MDANSVHSNSDDAPKQKEEVTPPTTEESNSRTHETPAPQPRPSSAGVIVLQWLTYAFWGWLILGLLWLMSVVLVSAILNESVNNMVPYAIAASVVLLPIAFVCDLFYRKHEPRKKAGGAMVIMIIHAVLFALLGIISLIVTVFIGVNALINIERSIDNQMVALLTALFAAILYAGAFVRTLNPFKSAKPALIYSLVMLGITVALLGLTAIGPVVKSVATRDDRIVERALPLLKEDIDTYIEDNNKLPQSLTDVTLTNDKSKQLVGENKVEYKAVGKVEKPSYKLNTASTFRYQLCVDYKAPSKGNSSYYDRGTGSSDYTTYLSTYSHGEGRTCYKLEYSLYSSADLN